MAVRLRESPDCFAKAAGAGADETILDLEDAVAPDAKLAARENVRRWLDAGGRAWVRVNGVGTAWHDDDLVALTGSPGLRGLIVPKAEEPAALMRVAAHWMVR